MGERVSAELKVAAAVFDEDATVQGQKMDACSYQNVVAWGFTIVGVLYGVLFRVIMCTSEFSLYFPCWSRLLL